jgi:hypothetical protein
MAKAKTLAALAGLAGLAYAMNKRGNKDDAGDQKSSSYAPPSNMTPMRGVGDATNDAVTNESAYATRSNMTPMQGVGDAENNPLVRPRMQRFNINDMPESVDNTPESPSAKSDQLANLSRAVKREAKTKRFADDVPYQESAQKTDALAVASRAARAADARRRMAKQSSYKSGGMVSKVSSASRRADGIATKGKTRGKIC